MAQFFDVAEKEGDLVRALEILEVCCSPLGHGPNAAQALELVPLKGDVETCVMKYELLSAEARADAAAGMADRRRSRRWCPKLCTRLWRACTACTSSCVALRPWLHSPAADHEPAGQHERPRTGAIALRRRADDAMQQRASLRARSAALVKYTGMLSYRFPSGINAHIVRMDADMQL